MLELRRLDLRLEGLVLFGDGQHIESGAFSGRVADLAKQLGSGAEKFLASRHVEPAQAGQSDRLAALIAAFLEQAEGVLKFQPRSRPALGVEMDPAQTAVGRGFQRDVLSLLGQSNRPRMKLCGAAGFT